MQDIKEILRKLKPFIGKKADALWVRYRTGDRIEKQEWEQVINLLVTCPPKTGPGDELECAENEYRGSG
jgi:hypothetical protein